MKRTLCALLVILLMLGGCASPMGLSSGKASLCLLPRISGGITTQTVVPVYSKTSINHLLIKLFTLAGETEVAVMNGGTQLSKDIPNSDLDFSVTFSNLKANTTYRVRAYAYKVSGTNDIDLISTATSYIDIAVGSDDRPTAGNIPVVLINKDFNGQGTGSLSITNGGFYTSNPEDLSVPYRISSLAGIFNYGENVLATNAHLGSPRGLASDADGNIYISDTNAHRIRKVAAGTGLITTVAGNGITGVSGDGGIATNATLCFPAGIAVANNSLYIADQGNHRIRKVDLSTGIITTVAGNGTASFAGDGGQATNANLNAPIGITVANNCLYIADQYNQRIRKVDLSTGIITTIAGNGTQGYAGDSGQATSANLNCPSDIAVASNILYIADLYNNRVRKVDLSTGIITSVAGNGVGSYAGDSGQATSASLNGPFGVTVANSNLYIAEQYNNRIRKVDLGTGIITTIAGNGAGGYSGDNGQATSANLNAPTKTMELNGCIYICDQYNSCIRKVDLGSGLITTTAGNGTSGYLGDGGPATGAALNLPTGVAVGNGSLYIADQYYNRVRKINLSTGIITTVAGIWSASYSGDGGQAAEASLNSPSGVAVGNNSLFIADQANQRIRKVDLSTGIITTVAGNGTPGYNGDGIQATTANLNSPNAVAVVDNSLYICDQYNQRIRKVDLGTGIITTVAGNGAGGWSGDGAQATDTKLNCPRGIAVANNCLYITDLYSQRIRKVDLTTGIITTVVGNWEATFAGDGGLAVNANLNNPYGITVANGCLYIADQYNHRIRRVDLSTGIITTIAGNGAWGFASAQDGGLATNASLFLPSGVAADEAGNIYVADQFNNRVRRLD